ncbi:MAG: hypothetical protein AB7V46_22400 [Thermomicrobiales bacterium]
MKHIIVNLIFGGTPKNKKRSQPRGRDMHAEAIVRDRKDATLATLRMSYEKVAGK